MMIEFKVGERWTAKSGRPQRVLYVGDISLFFRDLGNDCEGIQDLVWCRKNWTKTHEADGAPVAVKEPGEQRCEIDWGEYTGIYTQPGKGRRPPDKANGFSNFEAWEYEDGYRSRVSPTLYRHKFTSNYQSGVRPELTNMEKVRAVAVILKGGE